jgi:hypothetical protein
VRKLGRSSDGRGLVRLQVHGFGLGVSGHAWAEGGLCGDMDVAAQKISEVHEEAAKVHQVATGLEIDEEVDVAAVTGVAASDGSEDAHMRYPATVGCSDDVFAARA